MARHHLTLALLFSCLSAGSAEFQVEYTKANEVLSAWNSGQLTGICPFQRISPDEMERFKQDVVASGFLTSTYGRGPTECTMVLCPKAKVAPYVLASAEEFNRVYHEDSDLGRPCYTNSAER